MFGLFGNRGLLADEEELAVDEMIFGQDSFITEMDELEVLEDMNW